MSNQLVINAHSKKAKISPMIYGHFAEHLGRCIYEGFYVGEDSPIPNIHGLRLDIIEALKKIKIPCLRWPGGCFADEYHWMDGIGPKENRPSMVNTHWGGVSENNHFGTHEFFELCELLGAEPYICGNVGSGTVREMSEWVEYMTSDAQSPMTKLRAQNGRKEPWKLKYFGIGNENWNCGGRMTVQYYTDEMMRYNLYARDYGDNHLYRIACGPRNANYKWTQHLMKIAAPYIDAISLHYYTRVADPTLTTNLPDGNEQYLKDESISRASATDFTEGEWFKIMEASLYLEELIHNHTTIMNFYDPEKKVDLIIDEWGTWFDCEPGTNPGFLYQQNTLRDAVSAGTSLNIFNNHADRIHMTNIAQTINVLQAMILTDGPDMLCTPTYHVFDMYKVHQGADLLDFALICGDYQYEGQTLKQLNASVSRDSDGNINLTVVNIDAQKAADLTCHIGDAASVQVKEASILTSDAMNAKNTFESPDALVPRNFDGYELDGDQLTLHLPPKSVLLVVLSEV